MSLILKIGHFIYCNKKYSRYKMKTTNMATLKSVLTKALYFHLCIRESYPVLILFPPDALIQIWKNMKPCRFKYEFVKRTKVTDQ